MRSPLRPAHRASGCSFASALLSSIFLSACGSDHEVLHIPWPPKSYPAAFLVEVGAEVGRVVHGPFGLEDGSVTFGPEVYFANEGAELYLLGLRSDALDARVPLFDPRRAAEAELSNEAVTCPRGRFESDSNRVFVDLDSELAELSQLDVSGEVFRPSEDLSVLGRTLTAWLPIHEDRCIDDPIPPWRPFGGVSALLDLRHPAPRDVVHVNQDRLIVGGRSGLTVVDRSADPRFDDPRHQWPRENLGSIEERDWSVIQIEGRELSADRWQLVALARGEPISESDANLLLEFTWTSSAGFQEVRRSAVYAARLRTFSLRSDGAIAVVGTSGRVLIGPRVDTLEEWRIDAEFEELTLISETGDPADPYVAVSEQGGLWFGDPYSRRLRRDPTSLERSGPSSIVARSSEAGTELWVSFHGAQMQRRSLEGLWTPFDFYLPPGAEACSRARDECGLPVVHTPALEIMVSAKGNLIMPSRRCSAVFHINPDRRCAVMIPGPVGIIEALGGDEDLGRMSATSGRMVVAGTPGRLLELEID